MNKTGQNQPSMVKNNKRPKNKKIGSFSVKIIEKLKYFGLDLKQARTQLPTKGVGGVGLI